MNTSRVMAFAAWIAITAFGVWCIWVGYPAMATCVLLGMSGAVIVDGVGR